MSSDLLYSLLQIQFDNGNINTFIREALTHYGRWTYRQPDILAQLKYILDHCRQDLTKKSLQVLDRFSRNHPDDAKVVAAFLSQIQEQEAGAVDRGLPVGSALFPAAASDGALYSITVLPVEPCRFSRSLDAKGQHLLDRVGAALFSRINHHTPHTLIWNPSAYTFVITNRYHSERHDVSGDSMGTALALALFSHLSGIPVPRHVISTARVDRAGSLYPVGRMAQKLSVVQVEGEKGSWGIIAEDQQLPDFTGDLDLINFLKIVRVKDIDSLIQKIFPAFQWNHLFSADGCGKKEAGVHLDMSPEIDALSGHYRACFFDTCMENAGLLIPEILHRMRKRSGRKKGQGMDLLERYLFHCYWKLGACHCHKGDVATSKRYLKKADELYRQHPGKIPARDYFNCQNNYGVLLKDLFLYDAAEKVHLSADKGLQQCGDLLHLQSENLSSLSQLYLARHDYDQALYYQQQARQSILESEQHRNLTYLAWIYTRMGAFDQAKKALNKAKEYIVSIPDRSHRNRQLGFYHWAAAEYRYRKILSLKRIPRSHGEWFCQVVAKYESLDNYVPALIQKFSLLGLIHMEKGIHGQRWTALHRVLAFFEGFDATQFPMMHLLGATVAMEILMARHHGVGLQIEVSVPSLDKKKRGNGGRGSCYWKAMCLHIISSLSVQRDIHAYFKKNIHDLKSAMKRDDIGRVVSIIKQISHKIPY